MIGYGASRRGGRRYTHFRACVRAYGYMNTPKRQALLGELAVFVTTMFPSLANDEHGVEPIVQGEDTTGSSPEDKRLYLVHWINGNPPKGTQTDHPRNNDASYTLETLTPGTPINHPQETVPCLLSIEHCSNRPIGGAEFF